MAQSQDVRSADLSMDPAALYLEEIFTDRRVGTIRRLTPVNAQGEPDRAKPVTYTGETQVVTPMGALPIAFEIEAGSLDEAAKTAVAQWKYSPTLLNGEPVPVIATVTVIFNLK